MLCTPLILSFVIIIIIILIIIIIIIIVIIIIRIIIIIIIIIKYADGTQLYTALSVPLSGCLNYFQECTVNPQLWFWRNDFASKCQQVGSLFLQNTSET